MELYFKESSNPGESHELKAIPSPFVLCPLPLALMIVALFFDVEIFCFFTKNSNFAH